jgi:uncharacterized protein YsxB (DUF464 family)
LPVNQLKKTIISITENDDGIIIALEAEGHIGGKENTIACASLSTLLRTVCETLAVKTRLQVDTPEQGRLYMRIVEFDIQNSNWLLGISDFLKKGIHGIKRDYPDFLEVKQCRIKA